MGGNGVDYWGQDDNARQYHDYTRRYSSYLQTSRDLVARAELTADSTVVDLCCGTGITTEAILAALSPGGMVTGVDGSAAMLATAASSIPGAIPLSGRPTSPRPCGRSARS
jgi:trans-aconitate methyltransferase